MGVAFTAHARNRCGLRIVKKHEIVIVPKELRVALRGPEVGFAVRFGQFLGISLQTVVDLFGYLKEAVIACNRLPSVTTPRSFMIGTIERKSSETPPP